MFGIFPLFFFPIFFLLFWNFLESGPFFLSGPFGPKSVVTQRELGFPLAPLVRATTVRYARVEGAQPVARSRRNRRQKRDDDAMAGGGIAGVARDDMRGLVAVVVKVALGRRLVERAHTRDSGVNATRLWALAHTQ